MTSFNAFISGPASGAHGTAITVNLHTTGKQATEWVVGWGDLTPNTTLLASSYPGGVFPALLAVSHTYASADPYTITATATPTTGGAVTATYALNAAFGNSTSGGLETDTPSGATGNAGGIAMAIDTSTGNTYSGYIYVLSVDGSYAAVSRFKPTGGADSTFGDSTTPGTFVLTGLGTGTPTSIAVSGTGRYVAGAGQFNGWGAALIDTTQNLGAGRVEWTQPDVVSTGKANALAFEDSDHTSGPPPVYLAGQVTGCSPHASCMAVTELNLSDGTYCTGFNSDCGPLAFAACGCTCGYATAIIDMDSEGTSIDEMAVAGYTTYAGGSDFTLVEMNDHGSLNTSFGTDSTGIVRTNIGARMGSGNGAVNNPSSDFATSVTYDSTIADLVVAGYTNATGSTNHVALAAYTVSGSPYGILDTSFGPYTSGHTGVSVGPVGVANSIVTTSAGALLIGGTVSNDFLAAQFTSAGLLDTSNFGTGGIFTIDFGDTSSNSTDAAGSIGIETDPTTGAVTIVLGGSTTPSGGNAQIALADLLTNPSINIT
jgi:hypothetical protein